MRRFFSSFSILLLLGTASLHADSRSADQRLEALAREFWHTEMETHPTWATNLGVPGGDHRLQDNSPEAIARHRADLRELREEAARIRPESLSPARRITRDVLLDNLDGEIRRYLCRGELWRVDQMYGPQVSLLSLPETTRVDTPARARDYRRRLESMAGYIDQHIANLRAGLEDGLVAPRVNVLRVIGQLHDLIARPLEEDPLVEAAEGLPENWSEARRSAHRERLIQVVRDEIRPAFRRYLDFLAAEVLPRARRVPGLQAMPGGERCYRELVRRHTTLDLSPAEIHETGLAEMASVHEEMRAIADDLFPGRSLGQVLEDLRRDPKLAFDTREAIVAKAEAAVGRAWEALPRAFHRRPDAPVRVKAMEPHAEKDAPMAYYRRPSADGSRPGTYYVNTYEPATRPRYTAEVLAFHEAVPGHHLQIALAQEQEGIPAFQRHSGPTAFVEGWALYAERVGDEMGLYSSELDRLGMLSFEAWRAGRLVVDTGIHTLGWSREEAIDYLRRNTAASLPNISNEVDRYINIPGQALAYKLGQLEILALRRRAEESLGPSFDLREFHRRVLRNGAIPLPVLEREIEAWIREAGARR